MTLPLPFERELVWPPEPPSSSQGYVSTAMRDAGRCWWCQFVHDSPRGMCRLRLFNDGFEHDAILRVEVRAYERAPNRHDAECVSVGLGDMPQAMFWPGSTRAVELVVPRRQGVSVIVQGFRGATLRMLASARAA